MKYISKYDLNVGDVVWACGYSVNSKKENMAYSCKPIKGEIVREYCKRGFIPYKKDGTLKTTASFVLLDARHFANNECECTEIYNKLVQGRIDWLKGLISEVEKDFVQDIKGELI